MPSSTTDKEEKVWTKWFKKFARQEIASKWKPTPSKNWTVVFYMVVAVLFLAMGALFLEQTLNLVELRERYDDKGEFAALNRNERFEKLQEINTDGKEATVQIPMELKEEMKAPVGG